MNSKETHEPMDLDEILDEFGHFGKFQCISLLVISFPIIFSAIFALSYIFTAGGLNYRCRIPECEEPETSFQQEWLSYAVPFQQQGSARVPSRCLRYGHVYTLSQQLGNESSAPDHNTTCSTELFNRSSAVRCDRWVYEGARYTILREWDITCEDNQWALSMVGTVNNVGQFIGMPIAGVVSDRIGRKKTLVLAVLLSAVMGIARSLAWSYMSFLAFEFLDPLCGSGLYTAGFVLGMELVGPQGRVFAGAIISVFYTIGEVILGVVSLWLQKWRLILRAVYFPAFLCVAHHWLATESVRWLLTKGRLEEARDIILKAATTNGIELSQQSLSKIEFSAEIRDKTGNPQKNKNSRNGSLMRIFQSKILLRRLLSSAFCWFSITFVFFGLSLNSVLVGGNQFTNFILVALIELPAYVVFYFAMDRLGRKYTLCLSLILSGISCISFAFLPAELGLVQLLVFMLGKFGITISFAVVFVFTAELFPTELRHSTLACCSMLGRIGSVIAPQTPLLERYLESLPLLLFGSMAMLGGLLAFSFPETLNVKLPDTIEEAENIGNEVGN